MVSRKKEKKIYGGKGINDSQEPITKGHNVEGKRVVTWRCPYYERWRLMFKRCYSENSLNNRPTYKEVFVCDEWKYFTQFKEWMSNKDWEDKELDKDILSIHSTRKEYSPETCSFVPAEINSFMLSKKKNENNLPLGVSKIKGTDSYRATISRKGKRSTLRQCRDVNQLHRLWQIAKLDQGELLLNEYKDSLEDRVVDSIRVVLDELSYRINNNIITDDLLDIRYV